MMCELTLRNNSIVSPPSSIAKVTYYAVFSGELYYRHYTDIPVITGIYTERDLTINLLFNTKKANTNMKFCMHICIGV